MPIAGDVPALGKLVIDNDSAADQLFLQYGLRSRFHQGGTTDSLFYQAESRLPQGPGVLRALTGASGGTVVQGTVTTSYQSFLSFASSGTVYPQHVGSYRVWARVLDHGGTVGVTTPTQGNISLALQWGEGDLRRFNTNDAVTPPVAGTASFSHIDLGQVHLSKAAQGSQRWEGRILAKGTDTASPQAVSIDCIYLFPTDEGYGEARAVQQFEQVTTFTARDEFNQSAGALAGKTLPVGGTWSGADDADDWAINTTDDTAERTAVSDTGAGRFGLAGTATPTAVLVQTDLMLSALAAGTTRLGVIARYVSTSSALAAYVAATTANQPGRGDFVLVLFGFSTSFSLTAPVAFAVGSWYTVRLLVDTGGRAFAWFFPRGGSSGGALVKGQTAALATGGANASGNFGIYDFASGAGARTRSYDNFFSAAPTTDAAVFASQSLEIRHDRVIREDSTGAIWTPVSKFEGDYLTIPPSAMEDRTTEIIIKASRNDPDTMADSAIDDISARLTVTPRYLNLPEPS